MTTPSPNGTPGHHADLADLFLRLGRELCSPQRSAEDVLEIISRRAYELVPSAEHASIVRVTDGLTEPIAEVGSKPAGSDEVASELSVRIYVEDDSPRVRLNLCSTKSDAFDESDRTTATLLATHGALALTAARRQSKISNLERALRTSRRIGTAMGILMASNKVTEQQAFDLLRIASQSKHRKLYDVADEVVQSGVLHVPQAPEERHRNQ